jgi:hypothetical protein
VPEQTNPTPPSETGERKTSATDELRQSLIATARTMRDTIWKLDHALDELRNLLGSLDAGEPEHALSSKSVPNQMLRGGDPNLLDAQHFSSSLDEKSDDKTSEGSGAAGCPAPSGGACTYTSAPSEGYDRFPDPETLHRQVVGALRSTIAAHGPIERRLIESAAKRVVAQVGGLVRDPSWSPSPAVGLTVEDDERKALVALIECERDNAEPGFEMPAPLRRFYDRAVSGGPDQNGGAMASNPIMQQVFAAIEAHGNVGREEINRFVVEAYGGDDQAVFDTYVSSVVNDLEDAIVARIEYRDSRAAGGPVDDDRTGEA